MGMRMTEAQAREKAIKAQVQSWVNTAPWKLGWCVCEESRAAYETMLRKQMKEAGQ